MSIRGYRKGRRHGRHLNLSNGEILCQRAFRDGEHDGWQIDTVESSMSISTLALCRRGRQNGPLVRLGFEGVLLSLVLERDADHRVSVWFHPNGEAEEIQPMVRASEGEDAGTVVRHGVTERYYDNGCIKERGTYVRGYRHGVFFEFGEDGSLIRKRAYRQGQAIGEEEEAAQ